MKNTVLFLALSLLMPVFAAAEENIGQTFDVMDTQWEKTPVEISVNCVPVTVWDISVKESTAENIKNAEQ